MDGASGGAGGGLAPAPFAPRGVALIDASRDESRATARPLRYLRRHGFGGGIYPIHPSASEVGGVAAYPSVSAVPGPVDHALVLLGAERVVETGRDCAAAGVRCVTVLSDGFAEAGPDGIARQQALLDVARAGGVRVLGPNSIGVVGAGGFACSANAALDMPELPTGGYGVISQSASMIGALLSQGAARGIGFSGLVSVGNESDLSVGEIGTLMLEDPACSAILLFLEAFRDRAALTRFARAAEAAGKPVLAYKLGRSEAGQALAATHTGALSGDDASADALLTRLGIARLRMFEALYEAPPLFFGSGAAMGRRVAVVSTTGGGGAMVVDALATSGLDIAPVPPEVRARLARDGVSCAEGGLIDLTLAGTRPELVRDVLGLLMQSGAVDAIDMVIGSSAQFHPELAVGPLCARLLRRPPAPEAAAPEGLVERVAGMVPPRSGGGALRDAGRGRSAGGNPRGYGGTGRAGRPCRRARDDRRGSHLPGADRLSRARGGRSRRRGPRSGGTVAACPLSRRGRGGNQPLADRGRGRGGAGARRAGDPLGAAMSARHPALPSTSGPRARTEERYP